MIATMLTVEIAAIIAIIAILLFDQINAKRVQRHMQAMWGNTGYSRSWTGSDGKRWRYELATGRIVTGA